MNFKRVRFLGYDVSQVNDFFMDIQERWSTHVTEQEIRFIKFHQIKNGYSKVQVDVALVELELAIAKRTMELHTQTSNIPYSDVVANQVNSLLQILKRNNRDYFRCGGAIKPQMKMLDANELSYHPKSVDKIMRKVGLTLLKKKNGLTSWQIKSWEFPLVSNQRGYSTEEVDFFLDKVLAVINAYTVLTKVINRTK